jgi:hypothetical protein
VGEIFFDGRRWSCFKTDVDIPNAGDVVASSGRVAPIGETGDGYRLFEVMFTFICLRLHGAAEHNVSTELNCSTPPNYLYETVIDFVVRSEPRDRMYDRIGGR